MLDWFRKKKADTPEQSTDHQAQEEVLNQELQPEADEAQPDFTAQECPGEEGIELEAGLEGLTPPEDSGKREALVSEPEPEVSENEPEIGDNENPAVIGSPKKGFFARLWGAKDEPEDHKIEEPYAEEGLEASTESESSDQERESEKELAAEETPLPEELKAETTPSEEPAESEVLPEPVASAEESPLQAQESEPENQAVPAEISKPVVEEQLADTRQNYSEQNQEGPQADQKKGLLARFKERLSATRKNLAGRIETLLSSVRSLDDDLLDELEELLITSDLGAKTSTELLFKIRGQVASKELSDVTALKEALKKSIQEMLDLPRSQMPKVKPLVIMVVGINGVGKTTTIAKLTRRFQHEGKKVLLAAGDTFRSAAVEQLGIWAERLGADIVAQPTGADPSAVVFDALSAAQARGSDVVIIDTAGRLHTKVNLMDELKKIKRVAGKALPGSPHHTILVLDGNTGQNAQRQAQTFHEAVGVDSIIITKLDGTAKGGVIISIANELKIPITYVGLGESFEDLQPFDPEAFTEAILGQ